MTVLALWYFYQKKVDICVLETGLGGRLDSVTACENSLIAFTNIDLDHQSILGETIEKISKEKAEAINKYTKHVFCVNVWCNLHAFPRVTQEIEYRAVFL